MAPRLPSIGGDVIRKRRGDGEQAFGLGFACSFGWSTWLDIEVPFSGLSGFGINANRSTAAFTLHAATLQATPRLIGSIERPPVRDARSLAIPATLDCLSRRTLA